MRPNRLYECHDPEVVKELIRTNPWGMLVSAGDERGPVVSHYPLLLDEDVEGIAILTHVGHPDEELHDFGAKPLLIVIQGHHGYISPSWYAPGSTRAPTWNFSVAHCYGVPEILDREQNLATLARLVEHFERCVDEPLLLEPEYGARLVGGTVGLRIPIERFVCKLKLSQEKDQVSKRQVLARLREPGPYGNQELAADMERVLRLDETSA
ncbi:MAG TPA: FMN-binding negative transcriptional regulator [Solirubrobacteraceae bacterium]|jgi:transcriptional regulator